MKLTGKLAIVGGQVPKQPPGGAVEARQPM